MAFTNPTSVRNGTRIPQQQPIRIGRNESGTYTEIPYETTNFDEASKYVLGAEVSGLLYDADFGFGKHKITYHFPYNFNNNPANEPPVLLWELIEQKAEKSILDSVNPLANACTQAEIYLLGLFQQNQSDYIITQSDDTTPPDSQTGTIAYFDTVYNDGQSATKRLAIASGSAARTLANLVALGVQTFPIIVPQLKYTTTVNGAYPIQALFTNVGSIISTPAVYRLYRIPANVLFVLPNYLDPATSGGKPVLQYGWYLNAPQINQIARLKFQIVQTLEYGLWPVAMFGTPIQP